MCTKLPGTNECPMLYMEKKVNKNLIIISDRKKSMWTKLPGIKERPMSYMKKANKIFLKDRKKITCTKHSHKIIGFDLAKQ